VCVCECVCVCAAPACPACALATHTQGVMGPPKDVSKVVFAYKKAFNQMKNDQKVKLSQIQELQHQLHMMQPTTEDISREHAFDVRIKDLNMKLVTLDTRLMEAQENKKNYALYILRMKEEDVAQSKEIDHLRNLVSEYDRLLVKMARMNDRISFQRNEIEEEIGIFGKDIDKFGAFADHQIVHYKRVLLDEAPPIESVDQSSKQREQEQLNWTMKQEEELEGRLEEENEVKDELNGWKGKVEYYEKRFHKITAATGLHNPDDIINKFFFNDEITEDLQSEVRVRNARIGELEAEVEKVSRALSTAKDAFKLSKWRDVDELQFQLETQGLKDSNQVAKTDKLVHSLAYMQEGVLSILKDVEEVIGKQGESSLVPQGDGGKEGLFWADVPTDTTEPLVAAAWWVSLLDERVNTLVELVGKDTTLQDVLTAEKEKQRQIERDSEMGAELLKNIFKKKNAEAPS